MRVGFLLGVGGGKDILEGDEVRELVGLEEGGRDGTAVGGVVRNREGCALGFG